MAASTTSPTVVYSDFISILSAGQNSGVNPLLLQKDQAAFLLNISLRGGYAHTRPPVVKIPLNYLGNNALQAIVENGYFQGGGYYRPDYGTESLIAQISGHLILFTQGNSGWDVTDISVPGDLNNASITQIWMWQSERWMIVNDGSGALPIFYDGTVSRRSYGPSVELGVTSADFTPPIIGGTVDLTLTAPYTGPFNVPVILNGAFYEPLYFTPGGTVLNAIFENLSGNVGQLIPAGTQIQALPSVAGLISVAVQLNLGDGFKLIGQQVEIFTLTTPFTGAIGQILSITGAKNIPGFIGFTNGATITWKVEAVNGNQITCTNASQIGSSNIPDRDNLPENGFNYPVGTIVNFKGSSAPVFLVARTAADFNLPAINSSQAFETVSAYTGTDGQTVYLILPSGVVQGTITYQPPAPPSAQITVLNLTDTTNNPEPQYPVSVSAPQQILSVPELPAGRMGAYGMARNWFSLADGISYEAGDIVGGASGTQAYNFRDSVLKTTENDFLAGGGTFRLPGSGDQITAMVFPPNLDASLGQGPLQIFTAVTCFSNNSPVDRTLWEQLTSPLQSVSLKDNSSLAQNSTILINSDTFFRSFIGWSSLVLARRDFNEWGNRGISNEMQRPLLSDNQSLLQFGSAMSFDNRFIGTAAPNLIGAGVFHVGLCVMNFDLISTLRSNLPPAWEGAWSGLNTMQTITGRINGVQRAFSFTFDLNTNKIELWELLSENAAAQAQVYEDDNDTPILSVIETAVLFNKDIKPLTDLCELIDGEMYLSDVTGAVNVKVFHRPDFFPCWVPWNEFNLNEDDDNTTGDGNKKPGYWMRIGLGQPEPTTPEEIETAPSPDEDNPANDRPLRVGYFHQFRIEMTGRATFRGLKVRANSSPQSTPAPTIELDNPIQLIDCNVPDDLQIYSLQGFIPQPPPNNAPDLGKFLNQIVHYENVCTSGTLTFSGVLPSWITMDVSGNQFIGKSGVFRGQTQSAADAEALSNLTNFVSQNIAAGNITCSPPVPTPDILWYKFVEGTGTTTQDFSGAGNNGVGIHGTLSWSTGPSGGGAVTFTTTTGGNTIECNHPSTWAAGDFSYSLWVNPTGTPAPATFFDMVQALVVTPFFGAGMNFTIDSSNNLQFQAQAYTDDAGDGAVTPGTWQMVTMTYSRSTHLMSFYVNGVLAGSSSVATSFSDGINIQIGGQGALGHFTYVGSMADVRIYGSQLTAQNVLDIFNAGAQ